MKLFYQNGKTSVFSILLFLMVCFSTKTMSQTTISTSGFTNNNGFSLVTFNFTNSNAGAVIITDIASICGASGSMPVAAYYKTSAIAGAPGTIDPLNGWNQFGSATITAVANTTTTVSQSFLSGLSLIVPGGSTYGIAVQATSLRYSTVPAGTYTFPGGGCSIIAGSNVGYGGDVAPNAPGNTPRGFLGSVTFISAAPCSGTPAPGNTLSSVPTVCPGINFALSTQNPTPGSGVTYQWQSSSTLAGPYTDIPGATTSNFNTTQTAATYYQVSVTCSGSTTISNPVQVLLTPPSGCYCTPPTTNCNLDDEILNVTFAGINNSSLCGTNGYTNYTTTVAAANVVAGGTYPMTVDVGPGGTEHVGVWIDYNQNGSFDATEFTALGSGNGVTISNNIVIPTAALLGTTRMRIRVRFNTPLTGNDPCTAYTYGETEDYAININPCIPASITTQPTDATIECGGNATFSVVTAGSGPVVKWQEKTSAAALWTDLTNVGPYSGTNTSTLTITNAPVSMNGYQYRAVYSGYCRAIDYSTIATLTVNPLVATVNPPSADICNGTIQQLTITNTLGNLVTLSEGFNSVPPVGWATKQNSVPLGPTAWYQGDPTIFPASSGASDSYIAADYANTDPTGIGTISNWLMTPVLNIKNGDLVTFYSRIPSGTEYPDRLEVRVSANGNSIDVGTTETSVGDFTTVLLTINPTLTTGVYPKVWTQFTATVSGLAAPTTGRIAFRYFVESAGGNAPNGDYIGIDDVKYISTGAVATGVWGPTTPNTIFTDPAATIPYVAGTPANSVYVLPTATTTYNVVVTTATCVSAVTNIPVTVNNPIGTVTDPTNVTICNNGNASFTVSAASGNNIVYQWQELTTATGATWTDIADGGVYAGSATTNLTLTGVDASYNGYQYRAVLTVSSCSSSATTAAATLTVNPTPTVVIGTPTITQLYPGITTTLTATASPAGATYQWYRNGVAVPNATSGSLVVDVDGLGEYSVTVVDVNGCAGASTASVTISARANDILFIYPSPNTGQFQVRYQSVDGNSSLPRTLTIYDSKGARVYYKTYNINAPYGRMDVDMTPLSKGIYRVELGDVNGNRIKTGSVLKL